MTEGPGGGTGAQFKEAGTREELGRKTRPAAVCPQGLLLQPPLPNSTFSFDPSVDDIPGLGHRRILGAF